MGPRFRARAFSSCGERGPLFIAVRGPFTIAAPPVAGHRLQTRRLSSRGSRAQLLRGTWDLPRRGLEPASPALAGRLSTTAPPGKPLSVYFLIWCARISLKGVSVQIVMIFHVLMPLRDWRSGNLPHWQTSSPRLWVGLSQAREVWKLLEDMRTWHVRGRAESSLASKCTGGREAIREKLLERC